MFATYLLSCAVRRDLHVDLTLSLVMESESFRDGAVGSDKLRTVKGCNSPLARAAAPRNSCG